MSLEIKKRGNSWTYVIDVGVDSRGNRKRKSKGGFKTKGECRTAASTIITQVDKGSFYDIQKLSFESFINKYLDTVKPNLAYKTHHTYKYISTKYLIPVFGKMELSKIRPVHIQDFYNESLKKVSGTTVRHFHAFLNSSFNQAIQWQIINTNPCSVVTRPKNNKPTLNVWDDKQLKKYLDRVKDMSIYLPSFIALTTGMREAEICGLRWKDIDITKKIIYVSQQLQSDGNKLILTDLKTKSSKRNIAITQTIIDVLNKAQEKQKENKDYFGENYDKRDFVLCMEDGRPYDPKYISRNFRRVLKDYKNKNNQPLYEELDIPLIRFHDLRHTHATLLLKEGINVKVVSERLGHSSVSMTLNTYANVLPSMQKEAADKLDKFFCPKLPTNCQQIKFKGKIEKYKRPATR